MIICYGWGWGVYIRRGGLCLKIGVPYFKLGIPYFKFGIPNLKYAVMARKHHKMDKDPKSFYDFGWNVFYLGLV